jgi:CRISPR type III-A-associated RAMP protein Csm4
MADYFEEVARLCGDSKLSANWVTADLLGLLNKNDLVIESSPIKPAQLGIMISRIKDNTISGKLAKTVFEALAGSSPLEYTKTFFDKGYQAVKELPRNELGELIEPISNQTMPRASISRTGIDDTVIYYIDRYYFHEKAGLYAIVQFDYDETKEKVLAALRLLADEGLGTDRNVGHGKFEFSLDTLSVNLPDQASYGINLGMYCPKGKKEWEGYIEYNLPNSRAGYSLVRRGGWMSEPRNTWRKRSVYMALPGGVFKTNGIQMAGTVINLEPTSEVNTGHPVWRNGQSIFLPCKG